MFEAPNCDKQAGEFTKKKWLEARLANQQSFEVIQPLFPSLPLLSSPLDTLYVPPYSACKLSQPLSQVRCSGSRRMLATPLLPAPTFSSQHDPDDSMRYRPSRDIETFNSLLPPPIEFLEGSSSGALAVPEGKYEPINSRGSQPPSKTDVRFHSRI